MSSSTFTFGRPCPSPCVLSFFHPSPRSFALRVYPESSRFSFSYVLLHDDFFQTQPSGFVKRVTGEPSATPEDFMSELEGKLENIVRNVSHIQK